ncbi:SCO family protein [Virgibacillus litoralis]|uniref:Protein SCO1/2 n=1 Tax=Virgibacillus litoralis TaxID=578221 RepID=A0ABS4H8Q5_9BACI|nr:SCO family protein [Virgibacillus litoralis]MBP1947292.1 protein SCO1/2 [Virgibacillus litoralis]
MIKDRRNLIAIILVIIFGIGLFFIGTDGFRAFTAESARTYEVLQNKPEFPSVTLEDSHERTYTFDEFAEGKYVFLTFMYTSCTTVCPQLEMNMADVYDQIPSKYIGEDIVFLSISFDPARDDPATLTKYRSYFGSDGETWRMARINDQSELDILLEKLGVIVIPDGNGDFTHNSAFYFIGKTGHLQQVMDFTRIDEAADTVVNILDSEEGE